MKREPTRKRVSCNTITVFVLDCWFCFSGRRIKFYLLGKLLHKWENEVTKTRQDVDDKREERI